MPFEVTEGNVAVLKALLPYYAGKVKRIYIDPRYNTGNENWVYNDAVNRPEMRDCLGEVVGREAEDMSRHDLWLCMMYPRLAHPRRLLRDDRAIPVSIGANDLANLHLLMGELSGAQKLVGVVADLPAHDGPKEVYGTSCRLGDARLKRERITFRQIPHEIKVH